jgi:hypothetical protein
MGHWVSAGEKETAGRHFGLTSSQRGRAAVGGTWSGGTVRRGGGGSGVLRKETTPDWANWAASASGPNALVGSMMKKKQKKWDGRAAKATVPKLVWAAMRNRKGCQILIQRNEIQI